jgi:hypothetical protein
VQFNLDGTPKVEERADAAAVGIGDRESDKIVSSQTVKR